MGLPGGRPLPLNVVNPNVVSCAPLLKFIRYKFRPHRRSDHYPPESILVEDVEQKYLAKQLQLSGLATKNQHVRLPLLDYSRQ
jgi:hypothetical protein